jgi:dolichyl-phosphate-mannose-protein mannosyltransferase
VFFLSETAIDHNYVQPIRVGDHAASRRTWLTGLALAVVSLTVFLFGINNPQDPFYDEFQYVNAARAFLAGTANTNPEAPPLGKLLIALGIKAFGDNAYGWRSLEALCGALTLVGVFFWVNLLLRDETLALIAAVLTFLNNFLYVMSRVAMMDISLVMFLIWGLVAFTAALEVDSFSLIQRRIVLAISGTMFGLACACKWNGIDTLGIVVIVSAVLMWQARRLPDGPIRRYGANLRQVGLTTIFLCLLAIPVVAYALTYWPLCHGLHRPFGIRELVSMNVYIWRFHRAVPGNPAIASPWYSWIFQVAPQRCLSYLVGNWIVMWGGLLALAFCFSRVSNRMPEMFVVALYFGNLLQWAVTPQHYLYYYYYFPCAMFLTVAIPIALYRVSNRVLRRRLALICIAAAGCAFLFCFPHMAHLEAPFDCALGCWP